MIGTWYWKIPKVKVKSPLTPFPFYAAFAEHWNPGLKKRKNCFTNCFVIFSIYVDKIIFYRHYCCYAGDCSPRLHVTLGHSGEPGESNGCSEVPSAYYNTNFKHNCLCCCCWNGAIFLCWEAFPFNSHSTLTVIEIAFYLFCFVRTLTFLQYDVQFLFIQ